MRKSEPQGLIQPVTLSATEELKTYRPPEPWFMVDILNQGPDTAYIGLNDKAREFKDLEKGEARTFNFGMAKIERIYYKTGKGGTATLDLIGTY